MTDTAFENPHLWLASYGVRSHYFLWAVAHGALDDIDPLAGGREGFVQPSLLAEVESVIVSRTRASRARVYRSRAPHRTDVLGEDAAARRVRAMLGIRLSDRKAVLRG